MKKVNFWLKRNWKQLVLVVVLILTVFYVMDVRKRESQGIKLEENKSGLVDGNVFEYRGRAGVDALTLLKEKTKMEEDEAGMVVSIDGVAANPEKREFWGFYVNGEMAQVGAADYQTKDSDVIDWRIENY